MLHRVKTLKGYKLDSPDGDMGKVKDFYFDDPHWVEGEADSPRNAT